ncbi:NADH-quinone oxidoreductase subunit J [Candidatus Pseudomonas adelgestsugas]|uniref:NADH-quinone oxidoreductase subunit J n=1 Tax=Candidatus Pseudomonas adelgestsugas TaxID=1302376 RepID=A0ABX5R821_9PSED|nr:NADH-quinone oxidoreductase subunit J [Candidatus Pseudomonas adelgestsugas]QAX81782.1 NADH-quinone oxidoreductase subunit J [Candidatus Pseudomonas adelgestsugas]
MTFAFYLSSSIAVASAFRVITNTNPVHALLYLIISLISVAMIFFSLGAPFAGMLEMIAYAGAIMVLFVFVVMILNLGPTSVVQERAWLKPNIWLGPVILTALLLSELLYMLFAYQSGQTISNTKIDAKAIGGSLFGPYLLVVELTSMLLLAAAVTTFHLGRNEANE